MSALLRKYSDLTDDGRRIYDAISRRIEKIDRTRRGLLSITRSLKTRTPEERERAGARSVILARAKWKLVDFRGDMLGRIRPWHETGVIEVRAGVLSASFRLADVDHHYLSGLGLSTKWALIEGRGPVDLDPSPEHATS